MEHATDFIRIEYDDPNLIVTPQHDMREAEFQQIEAAISRVWESLEATQAKNILIDLCHSDYCGSTALAFFIRVWQKIKPRHGRMVLSHVSDHEQEVLRITHLDSLWTILPNREQALTFLQTQVSP